MSIFLKWAQKERSPGLQILALGLAGVVFLILLPYLFLVVSPSLDRRLGLHLLNAGPVSYLLGGILSAVGFPFAFWSIERQMTLAHGTPLPMLPTQGLLTTGPFRYCRNPMTLGTILGYLGLAVAAATIVGIIQVLCFGALLLTYIKNVEEKELGERFGEPYLAYKRQVPFIIPRRPRSG